MILTIPAANSIVSLQDCQARQTAAEDGSVSKLRAAAEVPGSPTGDRGESENIDQRQRSRAQSGAAYASLKQDQGKLDTQPMHLLLRRNVVLAMDRPLNKSYLFGAVCWRTQNSGSNFVWG